MGMKASQALDVGPIPITRFSLLMSIFIAFRASKHRVFDAASETLFIPAEALLT